jgi:hypothetical protein
MIGWALDEPFFARRTCSVVDNLAGAQAVPKCYKEHGGVPVPPTVSARTWNWWCRRAVRAHAGAMHSFGQKF